MNIPSRKPLIAMIALSAALATPAAFAQVDTTPTPSTNPQSTMQSQQAQQAQQEQMEAARQAAEDAGQPRADASEGLLEDVPEAMTQDAHSADRAGTGAEVATDASAAGTATAETAATGAATQSTQQATGAGRQQGWEELDVDKDGSISTEEASVNPGLTLIFADADADADGVLTVAEYRTFVESNYPQPQPE